MWFEVNIFSFLEQIYHYSSSLCFVLLFLECSINANYWNQAPIVEHNAYFMCSKHVKTVQCSDIIANAREDCPFKCQMHAFNEHLFQFKCKILNNSDNGDKATIIMEF